MKPFTLLHSLALALAFAAGTASLATAADGKSGTTERKTVTLINAEGKLDGSTEIAREAVRECIVSLPSAEAIEPDVTADSRFLREINGDGTKNAWTKVYTAKVVVNYMVFKKDMLIVATKSIEGKEPTLKEIDKRLPQSREFVSNPADGDTYAGRSNREYYYTTADGAVKDARRRAQVWLKQQGALLCGDIR